MIPAERHRPPVSTYHQALCWLLQHSCPEAWLFDAEAELPEVAYLVCDMFWVARHVLIRDLRREWNTVISPLTPHWAVGRWGRQWRRE